MTAMSSAAVSEPSDALIFADSFRVMTVTVSFGTTGVYSETAKGRRWKRNLRPSTVVTRPGGSADRSYLDGFEVDQRLVVVDRGAQLRLAGAGRPRLGRGELARGGA